MTEPWDELPATLDAVWHRLEEGAGDPGAPARHLVLATAGLDGGAEARLVVLRAADRIGARIDIHTDARTGKVAELGRDPRATLLAWDPAARLQIRLRADIAARPGTPREWAGLSDAARQLYGGAPPPGARLDRPDDHAASPAPDRFLVLTGRILRIETLRLGRSRHRRARFDRETGFAGHWCAP